jgi:biotin carboxyl carrier protein
VVVEGREHDATICAGERGGMIVSVDGREFEVRAAPDQSVLVRALAEPRQQRRVTLDGRCPLAQVAIAGQGLSVTVKSAREVALERALAERSGGGDGASRMEAPMPGRIVRVLVSAGEHVEEGAPVVIIEAMKMENELYAPISGVIASLQIAEGDTVDSGQLLCEFVCPEQDAPG